MAIEGGFEKRDEIRWIRPEVLSEMGEIDRTARAFSDSDENFERNVAALRTAIEQGTRAELDDEMWAKLENTDSFHEVQPGHMEDAEKFSQRYHRNYSQLLQAIERREDIPAPIIALLRQDHPYLVSGNTRLIIARAMSVRPQALFARVDFGAPEENNP